MPRLILSIIGITLLFMPAVQAQTSVYLNDENRSLLVALDSLLRRAPEIDFHKEASIATLRSKYHKTADLETKYWLANSLYDEYAAYDSDSAMTYIDRAAVLADKLGRDDLKTDMELNRAYILSATGMLTEADRCLSRLDEEKMSNAQLHKFTDRAIFLASHREQYINNPKATSAYPARVDSLITDAMRNIRPDDPYYGWFMGWGHLKNKEEAIKAINVVQPLMESCKFRSRDDALNAWVLSKLYEYAGDMPNKLKYLILSAMADIHASVKEIASLEEVAIILCDAGDFERANDYINYAYNCANHYKSRVRLGHIAGLKEKTLNAIYKHSQRQAEQNRFMLGLLICVVLVLVFAMLFIIKQMRQLARSRHALGRANIELKQRVAELQQTRTELDESNRQLARMYDRAKNDASKLSANNEAKEKYIANIFTICSDYITKLDDFRKNIYRMIVARRFDELRDLTKSPELSNSEIKELYANFDRIFLQIYPDFVSDFNTLLRPEERIEPRSAESLTTELRIYALVRLGLNDSVKIAKFLHISVQTVYNTRQRTRNKAAGPRDAFAEAVTSLGKSSI